MRLCVCVCVCVSQYSTEQTIVSTVTWYSSDIRPIGGDWESYDWRYDLTKLYDHEFYDNVVDSTTNRWSVCWPRLTESDKASPRCPSVRLSVCLCVCPILHALELTPQGAVPVCLSHRARHQAYIHSRGYSIIESGLRFIVNSDLDSVIKCILLMNLNPDSDSVNSVWIPFYLRRDVGNEF